MALFAACSSSEPAEAPEGVDWARGPDLGAVEDLADFVSALEDYDGPFTIDSDGPISGRVTRHFDGTNYSLAWDIPGPVQEQRLITDLPDSDPTCFVKTDGLWVYTPGSAGGDPRSWSFGHQLTDTFLGDGTLRVVSGGFEYVGPNRLAADASGSTVRFQVEDNRLVGAEATSSRGLVRTDRYTFGRAPEVSLPVDASDSGLDIQC